MSYCWRKYGHPLYLISDTHARMNKVLTVAHHGAGYELAMIPGVLLITLSPLAIAGVIFSIVRLQRLSLASAFTAVALFLPLLQEYQIARGGYLTVARYSLTAAAMLSVIAGDGLEAICKKLFFKNVAAARIGIIVVLFLNLMAVWALSDIPNRLADQVAPISPRLRFQTRVAEVGNYLKTHKSPGDSVVIDDYNVSSNIIADAAGFPPLPGDQVYLLGAINTLTVPQYISTKHPRFVVYSDLGTLRNDFVLPPDCSQSTVIDNIEFQCRFANNTYRVYELRYLPSP